MSGNTMGALARIWFLMGPYLLAEKVLAQASKFGIVEPFPENVYPIEGTSVQVTCIAFDSSGIKSAETVQFMRKDKFACYTNITATDNIYFEQKTVEVDHDGKKLKKLFVTMVIRNVSLNDDSTFGALGRYECHAFAVGDPVERKHGFTINVIAKAEIPSLTVSKFSLLQHGENIIIFCNVTKGQLAVRTVLKRISWFKDGVRKQTVWYPDLGKPDDTLGPMKLTNDRSRDGGNYTCLLEMLLRDIKLHFVSESTLIEIKPWFDKPMQVLNSTVKKGDNVSLQCAAQGYPLHIEWKFQKDDEDFVQRCITGSDGKHIFHRSGIYDPYALNITDVQYTDLGSYYCCLSSNCSSNIQDNCQHFVLRDSAEPHSIPPDDKKRCNGNSSSSLSSWMIIAVSVEGVLLVAATAAIAILVIKQRHVKATKEDAKGKATESIYLEIQEAPAKNPAQNSSNKQLGKIEHQIQAAPPCGKESGYSVLNHLAMTAGEGLYATLSASESVNSVHGASNFDSRTYVNQVPSDEWMTD